MVQLHLQGADSPGVVRAQRSDTGNWTVAHSVTASGQHEVRARVNGDELPQRVSITVDPAARSTVTCGRPGERAAGLTTVRVGDRFSIVAHATDRFGNPVEAASGEQLSLNLTETGLAPVAALETDVHTSLDQQRFFTAIFVLERAGTYDVAVDGSDDEAICRQVVAAPGAAGTNSTASFDCGPTPCSGQVGQGFSFTLTCLLYTSPSPRDRG